MSSKEDKIRMIVATLGLETHWRGAATVARELRDSGMEVIYISNASVEGVIQTAIQEDVDVVGISTLMGTHLTLGKELLETARQKGVKDRIVFVIGGVFPPHDIPKLKRLGFDSVFSSGATGNEMYQAIRNAVKRKGKR